MDDDPHLLPSKQRRIVFFFLILFFAMKHGLHIAVHVFQINAVFGILIGIAMAAIIIYTFKSIFDRADRSDRQATFLDERRQRLDERLRRLRDEMSEELRKLEELNKSHKLREEEENKISPWYVGLNDDRTNPEKS